MTRKELKLVVMIIGVLIVDLAAYCVTANPTVSEFCFHVAGLIGLLGFSFYLGVEVSLTN